MKALLAVLVSAFVPTAMAADKPVATGDVSLYNGAAAYEVVIDGEAAEKIFKTLDSEIHQVGDWTNKRGNSITCGQERTTKKYWCTLTVNERGVL